MTWTGPDPQDDNPPPDRLEPDEVVKPDEVDPETGTDQDGNPVENPSG
jgi:hypothetical protein